jgi:hypothetical protein
MERARFDGDQNNERKKIAIVARLRTDLAATTQGRPMEIDADAAAICRENHRAASKCAHARNVNVKSIVKENVMNVLLGARRLLCLRRAHSAVFARLISAQIFGERYER